ncbi:MAG: hypothetical protein GOVbin4342_4 [Prokaryotic dsDNA virus sp.]|nr:MAG: hypothetical protein GOVbin4342_4 [Prokaryotic dsDNA virus sp.]|tara:strand:+ start:173 stop:418 length:246 start_codon:yes stop_codon:yes gene_type:complete
MYIKIKKERVNFDNVLSYRPVIKNKYDWEKRKHTEEETFFLVIDTVGENEDYGGITIQFDTKIELDRAIDKIDFCLVDKII